MVRRDPIEAALALAHADAEAFTVRTDADGFARTRRVVIGDLQAPAERFFHVLALHGLLGEDGRLARDVELVSIGDHFDYGGEAEREGSGRAGEQILAWLAAHPRDQVRLIVGNHDLARVTELGHFDDATFARVRDEAQRAYNRGAPDVDAEAALKARYPELPTAELVARDYSSYTTHQRTIIDALLRAGRMQLAVAEADDLLLVHAGLTLAELAHLGIDPAERASAPAIARALDALLTRAVERRAETGAPLDLSPLHLPGNAERGESRGFLQHRPAHPSRGDEGYGESPARRFDPRTLPRGLTQVIGHIRDKKARSLLGPWAKDEPDRDGPLRELVIDGTHVEYRRGVGPRPPGHAQLVFVDGGLFYGDAPESYELFDLVHRRAITPRAGDHAALR